MASSGSCQPSTMDEARKVFQYDAMDHRPGAVCGKPDDSQLSAWLNALAVSNWTGAVCWIPWCPFFNF